MSPVIAAIGLLQRRPKSWRYFHMITQLNPPLPMKTSKGDGWAHFVIDYGAEADLLWGVFLDEDGQCWSIPNQEIRIQPNWSLRRRPGRDAKARTADPMSTQNVVELKGLPLK